MGYYSHSPSQFHDQMWPHGTKSVACCNFCIWSYIYQFLGHIQCLKLVKTRIRYHVCVQSYWIFNLVKPQTLKSNNYNEKTGVEEKEQCFIIYKWTSLKSEIYTKNLTEKWENQFYWQKLTQIFCFWWKQKIYIFWHFQIKCKFLPFYVWRHVTGFVPWRHKCSCL